MNVDRDALVAAIKQQFDGGEFAGLHVEGGHWERCRSDDEDIWFESCGPTDEGARWKRYWSPASAEQVVDAVLEHIRKASS